MSTAKERLLVAAIEHYAARGIGDRSLRGLAAELGTSHRMLIYHFGSKQGLLAEVVRAVEQQQRDALATLMADRDLPPLEQSLRFWHRVTEAALVHGRLFFELSAQALLDMPHTKALRQDLVRVWLEPLTELWIRAGIPAAEAPAYARLGLAAAHGLLLDLLATGDRTEVDEAAELLHRLFAAGCRQ